MITKLNLASKPFRNRTLPYLMALLLLAIASVGAIISFSDYNNVKEANVVAKKAIETMNKEIGELEERGAKVQQELTPDQKALLGAAHKLVANKSFGWSRLFLISKACCRAASARRGSMFRMCLMTATRSRPSWNSAF